MDSGGEEVEAAKGRSAGKGLAALDSGEERTGSNTGAGISGAHQVERDAHHGGGGSRESSPITTAATVPQRLMAARPSYIFTFAGVRRSAAGLSTLYPEYASFAAYRGKLVVYFY